jgi:Ricin-type beta-trefoil lectin domain-like
MMKHLIWFGVVLALLLSVMPTAPTLAQYQVQPPGDEYDSLLKNWGSGLCLQPEYEIRINGLAIVQHPCNDNDPYQRWYFFTVRLGFQKPGIYWIINSGSGQCLDDRDGKTADRSPVQQWTCNWSTTMQWKLETVGYIPYPDYPTWGQFINMRSGKCLDVRAGSSAPGAALQIYHCTSTGTVASGRANLAQVFEWVGKMPRPQSFLTRGAR